MAPPVVKQWSTKRNMNLLNEGLSPFIQALLTDLYQLTMCYGYWKAKKHKEQSVFDLFFRKNPFNGEYTIFCGLEECLRFLENFRFSVSDIEYLKQVLPTTVENEFFEYLETLDASEIKVHAIAEGTVVFPKIPLLILEGPLAVCQLLETTLLNLVNYASLVATNAARFRLAAGPNVGLLEFGLRRAQGPNGGLCASKYCYIGGFDGTSNLLAGKLYGIPVKGTHAHSFVSSFTSDEELLGVVHSEVDRGELSAFVAYAVAFPNSFLALVDTYDVLKSGVVNFIAVALALWELGYKAVGVRIDSGDLAFWSKGIRQVFQHVGKEMGVEWLGSATIVASNDVNEDTIDSLNQQKHEINAFGVGTHLVTCQKQPALGCVFKLVSVSGKPRIKLSQDVSKVTIPGHKRAYRMYSKTGNVINDVLLLDNEDPPAPNQPVLCRHPFVESKRAYVTASRVEQLHELYWSHGKIQKSLSTLLEIKENVKASLETLREDHKRTLNPTPYKVSVSENLYGFLHSLWLTHAPIGQLE